MHGVEANRQHRDNGLARTDAKAIEPMSPPQRFPMGLTVRERTIPLDLLQEDPVRRFSSTAAKQLGKKLILADHGDLSTT
jgi:hypothetical protein